MPLPIKQNEVRTLELIIEQLGKELKFKDKMAIRHSEVCKELKQKTEQIQKMEAGELLAFDKFRERIEHLELSMIDRESRITGFELELSRRKVEIALLEERLNPKPKWAEGIIAVEENRMLTSDEYGIYYHWSKEREDPSPGINYKGKHSLFVSDFVYQLVVFQDAPPSQPKPL